MYDIDGAFSSIRITDLRTCMFNALNIKIELNYLIVQIKSIDLLFSFLFLYTDGYWIQQSLSLTITHSEC